MKEKNYFEKVGTKILKGISTMAALVFILAQSGVDQCFIWNYQPKIPEANKKLSLKDIV